MYVYTLSRDEGNSQRVLNNGRDFQSRNERWLPALEFLTTYDSSGRLHGDCDDIAIAFAYIAQLQGKQGFTLSTATSTSREGRISTSGHALAAWIDNQPPPGSLTLVDTTGEQGSQAWLRVTQRNPGESDEALLKRAYQSVDVGHTRPFDASALTVTIVEPNGDAYDLPGNVAFCRQQSRLQELLQARNYRGVIAIYDQEIARSPANLDLRLGKIQMLILAGASQSEVTAVTSNLRGVSGAGPFNYYVYTVTKRLLLEQRPPYVAEHNALVDHFNRS